LRGLVEGGAVRSIRGAIYADLSRSKSAPGAPLALYLVGRFTLLP